MHERHLMNDLMRRIGRAAEAHGGERVVAVSVWLGALSHMTPDHFREHFNEAAAGTLADGARLEIETSDDIHDPAASDVLLKNVEVEVAEE